MPELEPDPILDAALSELAPPQLDDAAAERLAVGVMSLGRAPIDRPTPLPVGWVAFLVALLALAMAADVRRPEPSTAPQRTPWELRVTPLPETELLEEGRADNRSWS